MIMGCGIGMRHVWLVFTLSATDKGIVAACTGEHHTIIVPMANALADQTTFVAGNVCLRDEIIDTM